jgi:hypothetical protein
VDSDEHRRTMRRRNPARFSHRKAHTKLHLHNPGQQCEARTNEGPDPMPIRLWRTERLRRF